MRARLSHRLALLEAASPEQAWEHTRGLATLLDHAKTLPARDPWDLPEVSDTGLGKLLRQARERLCRKEAS